MLKYIYLISTCLIFVSSQDERIDYEEEKWIINSTSSLKVDGKTNINSFECIIPKYGKTDTLIYDKNKHSSFYIVKGGLKVKVNHFDCHHRMMTKDLQKTLKSDTYPYMYINFQTFSDLLSRVDGNKTIFGDAEIELSGETKRFRINYSVNVINRDVIELTGYKVILFSDFNLKPPSKLGGTIKVKNELEVEFKLMMKKY